MSSPMSDPVLASSRLDAAYQLVDAHVRRLDKDRWLAALYAPESKRRHLLALHAFSAEIGRIRDMVSDPLPGEIRARWWADMLAGARGNEGAAHPIAAALVDTIGRFALPIDDLVRLIEARIFELYDDPMPDMATLEAYCLDTSATLVRLAARVLAAGGDPGIDEAAGHAGFALGLTEILRKLPLHAARGQVFLPLDLLARHGLGRDDVLKGETSPGLAAVLSDLRRRAREEIAATRRSIGTIPPEVAAAFLPAALVDPCLDRMERPGYDPFRSPTEVPQWRRQLRLWLAARRARDAMKRRG
ncbi:MAG: squalene/phytoene synthase family protein [Siculibacillus sp.]|nr:squalene/phytoene synthase family protein [Siculibacillus sp.]